MSFPPALSEISLSSISSGSGSTATASASTSMTVSSSASASGGSPTNSPGLASPLLASSSEESSSASSSAWSASSSPSLSAFSLRVEASSAANVAAAVARFGLADTRTGFDADSLSFFALTCCAAMERALGGPGGASGSTKSHSFP